MANQVRVEIVSVNRQQGQQKIAFSIIIISAHKTKSSELEIILINNQKTTMKFSTVTYFMVAFVVTFASFGSAADVAPARSLRGLDAIPSEETRTISGDELRQLEIQGLNDYHRAMEEFEASNADRELAPDMSCYLKWCVGKVRGTCYTVYPKCYPL